MQIVVKVLNGQEHTVEVTFFQFFFRSKWILLHSYKLTKVQPEQTVLEVKQLLVGQLNVPVNQQRMMVRGKALVGNQIDLN